MRQSEFTPYGVRTGARRPGFWDGPGGLVVIVALAIAIVALLVLR